MWKRIKSWFKQDIKKFSITGTIGSFFTMIYGFIKPVAIPFFSQSTMGGLKTTFSIQLWVLAIPFFLLFLGIAIFVKSRKTNKRGQAMMEFLMVYGWAILVVLAVIGAILYFKLGWGN